MFSQMLVGRDVAKAPRDIALRPTGDRGAVPNDAPGLAALVVRLQAVPPTLRVLEATGGSHRAVVAARAGAARPLVVVHPRQVRDGAKATGPWAKPATLDARAVAHCAAAVRPARRPRPDAQPAARRALLARRRHRRARRTAEPHRRANAAPRLRADLGAHSAWLDQHGALLDDDRDTTRRTSPVWRERATGYRRVPGIGPVCARRLGLDRPEVGPFRRQRLAALVGVAPCKRARGTLRGTRTPWGGRAQVRATLDMRARVAVRSQPVRKAFSQRLCAAGTAKKVALTAGMRTRLTMLHALVKPQKPWHVQEGPSA